MFTCSTCLRRALESLAHDVPTNLTAPLTIQPTALHDASRRFSKRSPHAARILRSHSSLASLRKGHHRQGYKQVFGKNKDVVLGSKRRKAPWALTKKEKEDALARENNRLRMRNNQENEDEQYENDLVEHKHEDKIRGDDHDLVRPSDAREDLIVKHSRPQTPASDRRSMARAIREVETYYKDPLQLANGVLQRLRVPDVDGALQLVRASEHFHIQNIVSWNHCIDFLMGQGETRQATKVYNEMKKRGRKPDAHTYTIMLRGYSRNVRQPHVVQEAVKLYNSIFAPNSIVTPSTIHTNAIINVCARGGDMDALWAVAGRLPDHGPGSPDRWTFTTIFNAIRENAIKEASKLVDRVKTKTDREEAETVRTTLFEQALEDGRKLWEDVNYRWRRANLVLDEQLVCAMGRLLLGCGKGKDVNQIFDLVDTTMNLRIPERKGLQQASWLQLNASDTDGNNEGGSVNTALSTPKTELTVAGSNNSKLPLGETNVYAQPGNNTLSLVLDACNLSPGIQHWAGSYWHLLTSSSERFSIQPDANNVIAYLRVLRRNRASRETYQLLSKSWPSDVAKSLYRRATFIIAFSTCLRDKNNPNVFDTSVKLLRLMEEKLEEQALGMFGESLAVFGTSGKDGKIARKRYEKQMITAAAEDAEEAMRLQHGVQSLRVDPKSLRYFLELALATTPGWNEGIRFKDTGEIFPRDPTQNNTITALRMVAPLTVSLKRLVRLKLEEMQVQKVPRGQRVHRKGLWDPRTGSRVGERTEELMELMRALISAYDRVLATADRFDAQGQEHLDKKIVKEFDNARRQFAGYMAKIDKDLTKTFRTMAMADDNTMENEDVNDNNTPLDAESMEIKPQILQKLESIYSNVDRKILDERRAKKDSKTRQNKGFFHARLESSEPEELKISSRIQEKERGNLVDQQMQRHFPEYDYGTLDENLGVVEDKRSKKRADAIERRSALRMNKAVSEYAGKQLVLENDQPPEQYTHNSPANNKELKRDDQSTFDTVDVLVNNPEFDTLPEEQKRIRAAEIMSEIEKHTSLDENNSAHAEVEKWYSYAKEASNNRSSGDNASGSEADATEATKLMERERRRINYVKEYLNTQGNTILADQTVQDAWAAEHDRVKKGEGNTAAGER